ncbi:MAG: hypothetical protein IJA16_03585, partial [Clostridia bacterium]|nr:hypothetical protein [Clostridia bacterium]
KICQAVNNALTGRLTLALKNKLVRAITDEIVKTCGDEPQVRWTKVGDDLPREIIHNGRKLPNPEVLVMIKDSSYPTALYFDEKCEQFYETGLYGNKIYYQVSYWSQMPAPPEE